ncbi:MAG: hypothetical protein SGJ13_17490 [Actinomycetota bacterium]|nr:hypothetical protein [Actinomycetota bacterium]
MHETGAGPEPVADVFHQLDVAAIDAYDAIRAVSTADELDHWEQRIKALDR